jgi:hypothetical protein
MAGYDVTLLADEDRIGEAEGADTSRDFGDLGITVRARIPS